MSAIKSLLLVEGESDKNFFEELKKVLKLPIDVIAPPKEIGGNKNTKQGVYNHLPIRLKQLNDGVLLRLAIVVDADDEIVNKPDGYQNTLNKLISILKPYGFVLKSTQSNGLLFEDENDDGLADIGVWIMPNNCDSGMLEDFIKTCVHSDEDTLLNYAVNTVENAPIKKFKHKVSKAEIATWLALQQKPGEGLYHVIEKEGLLKIDHELFTKLTNWLEECFPHECNSSN